MCPYLNDQDASFFTLSKRKGRPHLSGAPTPSLLTDGRKRSYFDQLAWAGPATLNGLPATTAPIGRTETGLPIGVQIIGGYLNDHTTIAFAGMIEREFGGFTPPPML